MGAFLGLLSASNADEARPTLKWLAHSWVRTLVASRAGKTGSLACVRIKLSRRTVLFFDCSNLAVLALRALLSAF